MLATDQIDRQQAVFEIGAENFDALGEQEGLLELPRGNAPMEVSPRSFFLLPAADHQLTLLDHHFKVVFCKPGNSKNDP